MTARIGLAGLAARLVTCTRHENLPDAVVDRAKLAVVDTLACLGSGMSTDLASVGQRYAGIVAGPPGTTGYRAYPTAQAWPGWQTPGFVGGVAAFAENYGDTSLLSVSHPGSVVLPALLLAAQRRPVTGSEFLVALVVGYEVLELFARELNGGEDKMALQIRGFRPTPVCGPLGVVAAVGRALGLGADRVEQALGIAINHAAGMRRTDGDPLSAIRIQSGTAVQLGLAALDLAEAGVRGDPLAFEAPGGFLSAFQAPVSAAAVIRARLEAGPTAPWTLHHMAVKLHCTPQTLATALDCLLDIAGAPGFDVAAVESVQLRVPAAHFAISGRFTGRPGSSGEAATNYRWCAALALRTGDRIWPSVLKDFLGDESVAALAEKVEVVVDDDLTRAFEDGSELWPATATVVADGRSRTQHLAFPRGTRSDEVSRRAVRRKTEVLAADWPQPPDVAGIAAWVDDLEASTDVWRDLVAAGGVG